ncbi:hypothetical protein BDZ45DRAFT_803086 [Acephala macrosclerotiorum]|nr:hypothetical protein BDZ45DRAFT_803086 [Acephala macrosclerotiorum]
MSCYYDNRPSGTKDIYFDLLCYLVVPTFYISNVFDSDHTDDFYNGIGHCNLFVLHLVNRLDSSYLNNFQCDIKLPESTNFDLNVYVKFCYVVFFINNLFEPPKSTNFNLNSQFSLQFLLSALHLRQQRRQTCKTNRSRLSRPL